MLLLLLLLFLLLLLLMPMLRMYSTNLSPSSILAADGRQEWFTRESVGCTPAE